MQRTAARWRAARDAGPPRTPRTSAPPAALRPPSLPALRRVQERIVDHQRTMIVVGGAGIGERLVRGPPRDEQVRDEEVLAGAHGQTLVGERERLARVVPGQRQA